MLADEEVFPGVLWGRVAGYSTGHWLQRKMIVMLIRNWSSGAKIPPLCVEPWFIPGSGGAPKYIKFLQTCL